MERSKAHVFTMSIVAIIVGVALYKQIDFSTMTVEKPALSVLYAVTFFCYCGFGSESSEEEEGITMLHCYEKIYQISIHRHIHLLLTIFGYFNRIFYERLQIQ